SPHHRVPDRGARRAEPPVAEHSQLLPYLAIRVLRDAKKGEHHMREVLAIVMALAMVTATLFAPVMSPAQSRGEIVIGVQCDRTGATQIVGTVLCPGEHDYIALVNSKGGVDGFKLKALEVDHEYKVPPAVESYERFKKEGA